MQKRKGDWIRSQEPLASFAFQLSVVWLSGLTGCGLFSASQDLLPQALSSWGSQAQ